jgi:hypothetical protein
LREREGELEKRMDGGGSGMRRKNEREGRRKEEGRKKEGRKEGKER